MMNNKRLLPFAFSSIFLALAGCGGESTTINEDPNAGVKTSTNGCSTASASCMGFTVAYPVEGLNFDCSSDNKNHFITEMVGNTATGGCPIGDKVSFYIQGQTTSRKIELGTVDLKVISPLKLSDQPVQISLLDIAQGMTSKPATSMTMADETFKTMVGITKILQAVGISQNSHLAGDIQPVDLTVNLKNNLSKISANVTAADFKDGTYSADLAPWLDLNTITETVAETTAEQMVLLKNVSVFSANFLAVSALNADVGGFHGSYKDNESIANMYLLTDRKGYTTGYTVQWRGKPVLSGSQLISSIGRINLLTQVSPQKLNTVNGIRNWINPLTNAVTTPLAFKTAANATDQLDIYKGTLFSQKLIPGNEFVYKQVTGSTTAPSSTNVYGEWRQKINNEDYTGTIDVMQSGPATYLDKAVFKTVNNVSNGQNYIFPLYANLEFSFDDATIPKQKLGIVIDEKGDIRTNMLANGTASEQCLTVDANMRDANGVQQYRIGTTGAANSSDNDKSVTIRMILANPIFGKLDGAIVGLNTNLIYEPQQTNGTIPAAVSGGVRLNLQNLIVSNTTSLGINISGFGASASAAEWVNMHAVSQRIYNSANTSVATAEQLELAKRQTGTLEVSLPSCYKIQTKS